MFGQEEHNIVIDPKYGLGTTRSFQEFEKFGGFDFKKCRIQNYTLKALKAGEPPNPCSWEEDLVYQTYKFDIPLNMSKIDKERKVKFIALGILSKFNQEIFRKDYFEKDAPDVISLKNNILKAEFDGEDKPARWVVHPFYEDTNAWGERQEGGL